MRDYERPSCLAVASLETTSDLAVASLETTCDLVAVRNSASGFAQSGSYVAPSEQMQGTESPPPAKANDETPQGLFSKTCEN